MTDAYDGPYEDRLKNFVVLGLTGLAAVGSIFAFIQIVPSFTDPQAYAITRGAEAIGWLFFAAIYILLGFRPRHYPWLWELILAHRFIQLAGNGLLLVNGGIGAATAFIRDVILFALLVGAYTYGRGWYAWRKTP